MFSLHSGIWVITNITNILYSFRIISFSLDTTPAADTGAPAVDMGVPAADTGAPVAGTRAPAADTAAATTGPPRTTLALAN